MGSNDIIKFIGKNLEVTGADGLKKSGRCVSVDPVSTSFVLLNDTRLMVLPWVRVDNDAVVTLPDDSNLTDPETYEHFRDLIQYRKPPTLDKAVLKIRETALRAFLKENFFDNDLIDDTIVISNGLGTISPPYTALECQSRQQVVLRKMTDLIKEFDSLQNSQPN